jgi:hypothetical protein
MMAVMTVIKTVVAMTAVMMTDDDDGDADDDDYRLRQRI